jgi:broad specificity phosphatase PhoE
MGAIYLLRHGQASFGKDDYDDLSEVGYVQSTALGEALRPRIPRLDAAWSGTQRRHRQTAEHCLAAMQHSGTVQWTPQLNEFDADELIGCMDARYRDVKVLRAEVARAPHPRRAFQALYEKAMTRWSSGLYDGEYRESWSAFGARCMEAVEQMRSTLGRSKTAVAFTSGGPITAICQRLLGLDNEQAWRLNVTLANCSVTKIIYSERAIYLSTLNEHAHFEGERDALITYR